ncbi:HAD-IA family hydrolase [Kitasatospora sp. NPDC092948]|uniref:HAD-IA family hydrolase n=1 Tax=Kitasatospora sp. NPDC092948 TaxID=3364088 RepID=UPI0037F5BF4A
MTWEENIVEALDMISLPTRVASSSSHERLRPTPRRAIPAFHPRFERRIFSASEVSDGKPAPNLFLHAASRMNVHPCRCVVVEDSRYGVAAARAAGMRTFWPDAGGMARGAWDGGLQGHGRNSRG